MIPKIKSSPLRLFFQILAWLAFILIALLIASVILSLIYGLNPWQNIQTFLKYGFNSTHPVAQNHLQPNSTATASAQIYYYHLTGDSAWVENRYWEMNTANLTLAQADWTLQFALPPSIQTETAYPETFYLDKKLDLFARDFTWAITRQQWSILYNLATSTSQEQISLLDFQNFFNSWLNQLAKQNLSLQNLQLVQILEPGSSPIVQPELTLLWTFKNNHNQEEIYATSTIKTSLYNNLKYLWDLNLSFIPPLN